jgi:hypothetical protein
MSRFVIFPIITGIIGAIVADRKGRNWAIWGILCALFPLLLIVVFALPPVLKRGVTKNCPYCGQIIRHGDSKCRHCRRELPIEMVLCPNCKKFVPDKDYCIECHRSLKI